MRIEITMQSIFWLALTREDVEPLVLLAQHHYDGVCKAAARPGGFLYGWLNTVSARVPVDFGDHPLCGADRRQLDTALKICEMVRLAHQSKLLNTVQYERVQRFCATVMTALEAATRAVDEFHTITITKPTARGELLWATNPGRT